MNRVWYMISCLPRAQTAVTFWLFLQMKCVFFKYQYPYPWIKTSVSKVFVDLLLLQAVLFLIWAFYLWWIKWPWINTIIPSNTLKNYCSGVNKQDYQIPLNSLHFYLSTITRSTNRWIKWTNLKPPNPRLCCNDWANISYLRISFSVTDLRANFMASSKWTLVSSGTGSYSSISCRIKMGYFCDRWNICFYNTHLLLLVTKNQTHKDIIIIW